MKNIVEAVIAHVLIAVGLIFVYSTLVLADTIKVGDGPFVLAVSYSDSYKDLQYIANFPECESALAYFHANCTQASIMMCQAEDRMYMPVNHQAENTFSTFDFEVNDSQSCGFVKTQAGYSTFVEN